MPTKGRKQKHKKRKEETEEGEDQTGPCPVSISLPPPVQEERPFTGRTPRLSLSLSPPCPPLLLYIKTQALKEVLRI